MPSLFLQAAEAGVSEVSERHDVAGRALQQTIFASLLLLFELVIFQARIIIKLYGRSSL